MSKINIFSGDPSNFKLLISGVIILVLYLLFYISIPYIYGFLEVSKEENLKTKNKGRIKELILMKEIQNELEKEMEQSLLNASLNIQTNQNQG
ncbi:MAG: hypothetical protein PHS92_01125 [Candidatus Gracilibacteria bacterium]|nr:hypothetical protein [Candidatus Gracilibacteria bacterium]